MDAERYYTKLAAAFVRGHRPHLAGEASTEAVPARGRAREYLRRQQPFIWDATNLSRKLRGQVIGLCLDYGARVRVVYAEASAQAWAARNRARAHRVPAAALDRMLRRWEPPDPTEAHELV